MNSHTTLKAVQIFVAASVPALIAEEVAPRMADSPEAQRIRDLTLLRGTIPTLSPADVELELNRVLVGQKVRTLKALLEALQARVAAIDVWLRDLSLDEAAASSLKSDKDRLLKRKDEVGKMLAALCAETR